MYLGTDPRVFFRRALGAPVFPCELPPKDARDRSSDRFVSLLWGNQLLRLSPMFRYAGAGIYDLLRPLRPEAGLEGLPKGEKSLSRPAA